MSLDLVKTQNIKADTKKYENTENSKSILGCYGLNHKKKSIYYFSHVSSKTVIYLLV